MGSIPLRIRFDETDGFIKIDDGIRYLVLFSYLYDEICNRTKYLMSEKVVLEIVLITIFQKPELIQIILYLPKNYWLSIMS